MMMTDNSQNNMPIEEKVKNRKPLIKVIIIIVCIALLAACGYGLYNFIQVKRSERIEAKKKEEDKKKQQELDDLKYINNDSNEVVYTFEIFTSSLTNPCGVDDYFMNEKVNAKDISNSKAFEIASREIFRSKNLLYTEVSVGNYMTEEEVNNKIVNYFGKTYTYTPKSYEGCYKFDYNADKKAYVISSENTCLTTCQSPNLKRVTKAQKSDKYLILYVRVLFAGKNGVYYKDYDRKEEAKYLTPDANGKYDTILSNFSQTSLYKMTFTNDGNNYVFTSSELVENE